MEYASIEREIYVEASPEVVFDVVSSPEHVKQWWPDDAAYEITAGSTGTITFGDSPVGFTVVEVDPPKKFAFRWTQPAGEPAHDGNSLLVTFTLTPQGGGTTLTMIETGFREMGWDDTQLEQEYKAHITGWDHFIPRLSPYAETLRP